MCCVFRGKNLVEGKCCIQDWLHGGIVGKDHLPSYDERLELFRGAKFFEEMSADQINKLVEIAKYEIRTKGKEVIRQGEIGHHFFLVVSGELEATVADGKDKKAFRRYCRGSLFGERALMSNDLRAATVSALTTVELLSVSKDDFETNLGSISQLQEEQYMLDPRKCLADFFLPGDSRGPKGSLDLGGFDPHVSDSTSWFAVYRPTSSSAIALMLQRAAVGKGLNVKGKSAKKGRLSGLVPFLQISDERHKDEIEPSPSNARVELFFGDCAAREIARSELQQLMESCASKLRIDSNSIISLDGYSPQAWGLDVPEPLLVEAYIIGKGVDIAPPLEWMTGRASEPAFMNMNLHAVREASEPKVVIFQYDAGDAMNPFGLVIAYAEKQVKPVVSDFDTFLVGSCNMPYEALPPEQLELAKWSLEQTQELFENPDVKKTWTSRWLEVLTRAAEQGFYPKMPRFGFGDPISCRIVEHVIEATLPSGAVRHGAECFNFWFPQELDNEYLVVWRALPDQKLWDYMTEEELRSFLLERASEGYSFPLNPIWPVRDEGWYEVLQALLRQNEQVGGSGKERSVHAWFPPDSGVLDLVEKMHRDYPDRFTTARTVGRVHTYVDVSSCERAELGMHQVDQVRHRLLKEIETGRSYLSLDSDGSFLRTVSVIVLEVSLRTDAGVVVLVQVWDSGVDKAVRYRLPGHKLIDGETPQSGLSRLLIKKLGLMPDAIEIDREETSTLVKKSFTFACKTQYDRYIFHASLKDNLPPSSLSRIRMSEDDTLVYEVCNNGIRELVTLPGDECPLVEQAQSLQENDSVIDDSTGCEWFACPHAEDIGRVSVFSWMEPKTMEEHADRYEAPMPSASRRGTRRRTDKSISFRSSVALLIDENENDDDEEDSPRASRTFTHAKTQVHKARRRSTRQYTAPNPVRFSPTSSADLQMFTSKRRTLAL